jgi:hypothetical protein
VEQRLAETVAQARLDNLRLPYWSSDPAQWARQIPLSQFKRCREVRLLFPKHPTHEGPVFLHSSGVSH